MRKALGIFLVCLVAGLATSSCTCDIDLSEESDPAATPAPSARSDREAEPVAPRSPGEVVEAFFRAVEDRDDPAIMDLVHPDSPIWQRSRFQDATSRENLWKHHATRIENARSDIEIFQERIDGERAQVTARLTTDHEGYLSRTHVFELRKEGRAWMIWLTNQRLVLTPGISDGDRSPMRLRAGQRDMNSRLLRDEAERPLIRDPTAIQTAVAPAEDSDPE